MNRIQKLKTIRKEQDRIEGVLNYFVKEFKIKRTKANEKELQKICPKFSFKKKEDKNQLSLL